jgi:hypothetical protein
MKLQSIPRSLRAGITQFLLPPMIYLVARLLVNPEGLLADPLEGLVKLMAINLFVSIAVASYVWFKNRGSGK